MLTWLYVPGDRPERFAKAIASGADTVIVDLEDAVAPQRKAYARAAAAEFCGAPHEVPVQVRVNALGSPDGDADLAALAGAGPADLRLPKVESPAELARLDATGARLHCLIETALGVEHAFVIAASPHVVSIGLGEADLRSDLGVTGDAGLAWARGRIVVAARAAGLPPPAMSAYPHVRDAAGLAASCRLGRDLGFLGRVAIHPAQLPVIVDAFRPSVEELARAEEVLAALAATTAAGVGTAVLADGRFVDVAMAGAARRVVDVAARYPPA